MANSDVRRLLLRTLSASRRIFKKSSLAFPAGSPLRCICRLILSLGKAVAGGVLEGWVDQNTPRSLGRLALVLNPARGFLDFEALVDALLADGSFLVGATGGGARDTPDSDISGSSSMDC